MSMRLTYLGTASYFYDAVVLKLTEGRSVMEYARAGQGLCLALMGDHDPQVTILMSQWDTSIAGTGRAEVCSGVSRYTLPSVYFVPSADPYHASTDGVGRAHAAGSVSR